jgi:hypothetical protein
VLYSSQLALLEEMIRLHPHTVHADQARSLVADAPLSFIQSVEPSFFRQVCEAVKALRRSRRATAAPPNPPRASALELNAPPGPQAPIDFSFESRAYEDEDEEMTDVGAAGTMTQLASAAAAVARPVKSVTASQPGTATFDITIGAAGTFAVPITWQSLNQRRGEMMTVTPRRPGGPPYNRIRVIEIIPGQFVRFRLTPLIGQNGVELPSPTFMWTWTGFLEATVPSTEPTRATLLKKWNHTSASFLRHRAELSVVPYADDPVASEYIKQSISSKYLQCAILDYDLDRLKSTRYAQPEFRSVAVTLEDAESLSILPPPKGTKVSLVKWLPFNESQAEEVMQAYIKFSTQPKLPLASAFKVESSGELSSEFAEAAAAATPATTLDPAESADWLTAQNPFFLPPLRPILSPPAAAISIPRHEVVPKEQQAVAHVGEIAIIVEGEDRELNALTHELAMVPFMRRMVVKSSMALVELYLELFLALTNADAAQYHLRVEPDGPLLPSQDELDKGEPSAKRTTLESLHIVDGSRLKIVWEEKAKEAEHAK